MKKISLIVMSCIIACGLLANHGIVKGGEMSPKVEDTVSIAKKITDSQWLSNNSDMLEVDTAGEDSVVNVVAYFCKGDTCEYWICLLYTSPSPRDGLLSRMPSSA